MQQLPIGNLFHAFISDTFRLLAGLTILAGGVLIAFKIELAVALILFGIGIMTLQIWEMAYDIMKRLSRLEETTNVAYRTYVTHITGRIP